MMTSEQKVLSQTTSKSLLMATFLLLDGKVSVCILWNIFGDTFRYYKSSGFH